MTFQCSDTAEGLWFILDCVNGPWSDVGGRVTWFLPVVWLRYNGLSYQVVSEQRKGFWNVKAISLCWRSLWTAKFLQQCL